MARVFVLNETTLDENPAPNQGTLWFQWCRYVYDGDEKSECGYRFIWRRPDTNGGGLQAARGQARIPSLTVIDQLIAKARMENWGHYNGDNFPNALTMLWASVDDVLDPKFEEEQKQIHVKAFVKDAESGGLSLFDFEAVIGRIPIGEAYRKGDVFKQPRELYEKLDEHERRQLRKHFIEKVEGIKREFPELMREFPSQFRR
jgi:hypothetical protein